MPSGPDLSILLNITYKKTKSVITTVLAFLLTNLLSTIHYSDIQRNNVPLQPRNYQLFIIINHA